MKNRAIGDITYEIVRLPDRRTTFDALLLEADEEHLVLAHQVFPARPVHYFDEEILGSGYWLVWFLFQGEPFDVGRFYRPDGTWTGYYADVLEQVRWEPGNPPTIEPVIDLYLDLWIAPDGRYLVLDEDELAEALQEGHISPERAEWARAVLGRLVAATERGEFPPSVARAFTLDR
jgi:predicted RNA-binding protein associated with RNAse of E/G family